MQTMTIGEPVTEGCTTDSPASTNDPRTTDLVELMLKDRRRLDALIREDSLVPELIPRLLAVALTGFTMFGIAATLILNLEPSLPAWVPRARWSDGTWANLTLAYAVGLVAATGVCLPSFYFYGLLAGVKLSMLQSAAHAGEVPRSHVGRAGGGRADLRRRVAGDDRLLGPGGVAALDDHSGTGHAVRGGSLGSQNTVPGVQRSRRYAAGVSQGRAGVFPAPPDRGMGCLLHGGHAAHDHLALDAPFGLRDVRLRPPG